MKNKILKFASVLSLSAVFPVVAFAQASAGCSVSLSGDKGVGGLFSYITCLIQTAVIPLIFAVAIVIFVWGVVQFVINSDEEAKKEKGRQFMIWGIIGLTVMITVWSLVGILGSTFGFKNLNVLPSVNPGGNK